MTFFKFTAARCSFLSLFGLASVSRSFLGLVSLL